MEKSVRVSMMYAIIAIVALVVSMGILYPLTKSIVVFHMPIMTWGFLLLGIAIVVQGYVFLGKIDELESNEEKQGKEGE
ncbi:hypothetical protein ACFLZL_04990 [Thermodesulfobacteriota bacterium]